MLLRIYEIIERIENEIGNNATIYISIRNKELIVRIDWWDEDLHAEQSFSLKDLQDDLKKSTLINYVIQTTIYNYTKIKERIKKE